MAIADALLAEYDKETSITRRLIERIPPDKFDWKPHPKSTSMSGLGRHLAHMITWGTLALSQTQSDAADRVGPPPTATVADILALYDRNVAATRALIVGKSDEELTERWTLMHQGKVAIDQPRAAVVQSLILNHMIHHRGQLSVYLRLNDVPVPSIYGPSADER